MVQVQPGHMNFGSILRCVLIPLLLVTPELSVSLHTSISNLSLVHSISWVLPCCTGPQLYFPCSDSLELTVSLDEESEQTLGCPSGRWLTTASTTTHPCPSASILSAHLELSEVAKMLNSQTKVCWGRSWVYNSTRLHGGFFFSNTEN